MLVADLGNTHVLVCGTLKIAFMTKVRALREEEPSSSSKKVHLLTLLNAYNLFMAFSTAHFNLCK